MTNPATPFATFKTHWLPRLEEQLAARVVPSGTPEKLSEAMRYSLLLSGKRIRPLLVLAATETCGGNVEESVKAACAVEMAHVFSLIHDDLPAMDDDDERRGKPSNHKVYGEAQAILAGDALLARAFELLAEYPEGGTLCKELAVAIGGAGMCGGQSEDVLQGTFSFEERMGINARKTGDLIRAAVRIGALRGKANEEKLDMLSSYGDAVGQLFQITDDILDGDTSIPGNIKELAIQKKDEAIRCLEVFGKDAEVLQDLARVILIRTS